MQAQDKLYSFLGDRAGGGLFVGFPSGVMKERLVDFNSLTCQVNEKFCSH